MTSEISPKDQKAELEGQDNPVSARVIDLVRDYPTETGVYLRQTHSKAGIHYTAAYNPHEGRNAAAECFLSAGEKFRWAAIAGPSPEDIDKVNEILDDFEKLV